MSLPPDAWPAEWASHAALWIGWPRLAHEWGDVLDAARAEIAAFADLAAGHVPVRVAIGDAAAGEVAAGMLPEAAGRVAVPTGDIWLRDTGPVFLQAGGALEAACFDFNGWGGKYDMPGDRGTATAIAAAEGAGARPHGFVLEGGAVEGDGTGRVITTRQCLLNSNRNGWGEADAEAALAASLGVRETIWIERGLDGDHTDGHVDNIARFVGPGHVVCQRGAGPGDPHAGRLDEIARQLRDAGLRVSEIPSPGRVTDPAGDVLPASHLNFTITNGLVIVPVYEAGAGAEAVSALGALFPTRETVGLPARAILAGGGGAFHCMTCHVPDVSGRQAP